MIMDDLIKMQGISKHFGGVWALHDVDFTVGVNEVVGILGDNGAGKSTLIKILSGVFPADCGVFTLKGVPVNFRRYSVQAARKMGIETVYQERSLGDVQPLWRNIFVGRHLTNWLGFIKVKQEKAETMHILQQILGLHGVGVHPDSQVNILSGGERQGLAIGRAMYFQAELVILDEPTTALSIKEVEKVLSFIRDIKQRGKACIYISHDLPYVYDVSDRFVFMERGRLAATVRKAEISLDELTKKLIFHSQSR